MNTYLIPVHDDEVYITSVRARNISDAEDKFINLMIETYDLDVVADMEDLIETLGKNDVTIGSFYDIEEF